ncbi:MAG: hypothetical protein SFV81_25605, partial [Pirellulaceae bacterium]|nr:hypothetical protein [Pirellulaceae bacterium]
MTSKQVVALFQLEPSVDGGFGERTVLAKTAEGDVPNVQSLEYSFDDWSGDEIVTSFPCHL